MQRTLYLLIGPKGSGKTHIGTIVNQRTNIFFLRVEPIWLSLMPGEDGWKKVEEAIDSAFRSHDKVMVESLGIGGEVRACVDLLARKYSIKLIRVRTNLDTSMARVKSRDNAEHIPVSDERVGELNKLAAAVTMNWDLEIDNERFASDDKIVAAIQSIG